jgi:hypothetical protein
LLSQNEQHEDPIDEFTPTTPPVVTQDDIEKDSEESNNTPSPILFYDE